jgi:hypothetical protein
VGQKQPNLKYPIKMIFFILQYFFGIFLWYTIWVLGIHKKISLPV